MRAASVWRAAGGAADAVVAAPAVAPAAVRATLRALLRVVSQFDAAPLGDDVKRVDAQKVNDKDAAAARRRWRAEVVDVYRTHQDEADAGEIARLQEAAENYLELQKKVQRYQELLVRYEIGTRKSQKDSIRNTARRVGLEVPEW